MSLVKAALRYAKSKKPTFGTADHDRCKVVTANSAQVVSMAGDVHSLKHLDAPLRCLNPALHNNKGEPAESLSRVPTDTASDWSLGSSLHPHKPAGAQASMATKVASAASMSSWPGASSIRTNSSLSTGASSRRVQVRSDSAPIILDKKAKASWKFAASVRGKKLKHAIDLLTSDFYAPRSCRTVKSRIRTWCRITSDIPGKSLPLTVVKLVTGAARLKEARFLSAHQILYCIRQWHKRANHAWTDDLIR